MEVRLEGGFVIEGFATYAEAKRAAADMNMAEELWAQRNNTDPECSYAAVSNYPPFVAAYPVLVRSIVRIRDTKIEALEFCTSDMPRWHIGREGATSERIGEVAEVQYVAEGVVGAGITYTDNWQSVIAVREQYVRAGLGHHPDRMHDRPGDPIDWDTHQAIHAAERDVLEALGLRKDAFNKAFGNVATPDNLPKRRQYGNIDGKVF